MKKKPTNRIHGLAALAGTFYGAFLGNVCFGGSWIALGLGAFIGLLILSPAFAHMALGTAGILIGMSGIGPTWTEHHERRAQRIATIILVLLIACGIFGLFLAPMK